MEEAKKRDHRKLGKELELFAFSQRVGAGSAAVAAQGRRARATGWNSFLRTVQKEYGYQQVITPHIGNEGAVRHVGPLRQIRQGFVPADPHARRGRGVPAQTDELSRTTARSTRSNRARTRTCRSVCAEFGTVYRYEQSGRAARPDARAGLHAGRRPPVRAPRPAARRVREGDRHRPLHLHAR